jgi:hypothetical protein
MPIEIRFVPNLTKILTQNDLVDWTPQHSGKASIAKKHSQSFERSHGCSAVGAPAPNRGGPLQRNWNQF